MSFTLFITCLLSLTVEAIGPFLDNPPLDVNALVHGSLREKMNTLPSLRALMKTGKFASLI